MPSKSGSYCSCTVAPLVRAALRQSNRLNEEHDHHHGGCLVAWGALGRSLLEHGLQCIEGCPLIQVVSSCNVFQHTYLPRVKFRDHPCGMAHGTAIIWPVNGLMFKCHACTNDPAPLKITFLWQLSTLKLRHTYSRLINHHFPYSEWHPPKPKHPKNTKSGLSHIRNSNLLPSYSIPYCKCLHKLTICTSSS